MDSRQAVPQRPVLHQNYQILHQVLDFQTDCEIVIKTQELTFGLCLLHDLVVSYLTCM